MSHTLPDYTTKYKLAKIFGNVKNAELAARLGACSTMDRRGNLIWYDDFESTAANKWGSTIDPGGTMALSTVQAWMGNQSMKTVTDVDLNDDVIMEKRFHLPVDRRIGVEFMFCMDTGKPTIRFYLAGYTGAVFFGAEIMYIHDTGKLYYWNSAGAYVELTRYDGTYVNFGSWFYMKLVIDADTKKYVRLIFGSSEYDLSALNMRSNADASESMLVLFITNRAGTAAASTVYFDNVILTQNEP